MGDWLPQITISVATATTSLTPVLGHSNNRVLDSQFVKLSLKGKDPNSWQDTHSKYDGGSWIFCLDRE